MATTTTARTPLVLCCIVFTPPLHSYKGYVAAFSIPDNNPTAFGIQENQCDHDQAHNNERFRAKGFA